MSEPPTKIDKLDSVLGPLSQSKVEHVVGVSVFLCSDILLEVLRCLTRRQIIKLESTGGRIHRIVKSCLKREPYINRHLSLKPGLNGGLEAEISKLLYSPLQRISHNQFLFLRCCEFIRFENVKLYYNHFGFQSIDKKCHLFVEHLKPLKAAFSDSTKIEFNAEIGGGKGDFRDPLQLLNHLRNKLLPICDSARRYEFSISFSSHVASATDILDAILQMSPINSNSNVKFNFDHTSDRGPPIKTRLPVDAISAWLDRSNDLVMKCKQQQKTPLDLRVYLRGVQNVHELFEHFKKTFEKAESLRHPFIFSLHPFSGGLQSETLSNEKTGEELSIDRHESPFMISLKRRLKKSKN